MLYLLIGLCLGATLCSKRVRSWIARNVFRREESQWEEWTRPPAPESSGTERYHNTIWVPADVAEHLRTAFVGAMYLEEYLAAEEQLGHRVGHLRLVFTNLQACRPNEVLLLRAEYRAKE